MSRFLALAIPSVLLLMALFWFGLDVTGLLPDTGALAQLGVARYGAPPVFWLIGDWVFEALALIALFLLVQGRSGAWWLDGVTTGLMGWLFRGPALVLSIVLWSKLPRDPWWPLALRWLALYAACGLAIAGLARRVGLER